MWSLAHEALAELDHTTTLAATSSNDSAVLTVRVWSIHLQRLQASRRNARISSINSRTTFARIVFSPPNPSAS